MGVVLKNQAFTYIYDQAFTFMIKALTYIFVAAGLAHLTYSTSMV